MTTKQLGKKIAQGSTAEIYEWQHGEILKLFYEDRTAQEVHYEANIAKAVQETGLAPRVKDIIQVGNRWGIIYEKVAGTLLAEAIRNHPLDSLGFAKHFAELHARIHAVSDVTGLPPQLERLREKIQTAPLLLTTLRQQVLAHLETLPTGQTLCHGDFHPNNILVEEDRFFVIDWTDATLGHALADVTRTVLILEGRQITDPSAHIDLFKMTYLEHYFVARPDLQNDLEPWRPVIAAARLTEGQQQEWLLGQVRRGLG